MGCGEGSGRRADALELGLLVRVRVVRAEDPVEQFGDWIGDGRCAGEGLLGAPVGRRGGVGEKGDVPKRYIMARTTGAHDAPMERP